MKLLVIFDEGSEGPEITIQRRGDTITETNYPLFSKMCDMVEPAIYEALRQCVRDNLFTAGVCFWDGQRIKMMKG